MFMGSSLIAVIFKVSLTIVERYQSVKKCPNKDRRKLRIWTFSCNVCIKGLTLSSDPTNI